MILSDKLAKFIDALEPHALHLCNHHKQDTEDLLQELAVKAFSRIDRFKSVPDIEIQKYLYATLKNTFIDDIRTKKRKRQLHELAFIEDIEKEEFVLGRINAASIPSYENIVFGRLLEQQVNDFMKKNLPEEQTLVFRLGCIEDYDFRAIAEAMGANINTTLGRARYARKKLKQFILK